MIVKLFSTARFSVNIPLLNWQLMHNILDIAESSFSCNLVFYIKVASIAPYLDSPVTSSSF